LKCVCRTATSTFHDVAKLFAITQNIEKHTRTSISNGTDVVRLEPKCKVKMSEIAVDCLKCVRSASF